MFVGRGDVQLFDIAFRVGAGVLFVAEVVFAVFFDPARIAVFAGGGLGGDVAIAIDFDGLALFAAGGVDDGGVDNGCLGFLYL